MGRVSCTICLTSYEAVDKKPPCDTCRPPVYEWNAPYLALYVFCSDQYLLGPGGAVGLNFLAVDRAMDYYQIDLEERADFWQKVKFITHTLLSAQHEEAEAARKSQKH